VWLEGNVRPMFQSGNDMGPVEGSFKLENISLTFKLTETQQADLNALLAEQQDASSPNYHHWLTPEQYADRFGLSLNDITQVVGWLQTQGFQVTQTARSRSWVSFSGTAAQVQAAFQTEIHNFSLNRQLYYGNATEPAVPAALADVVLGFRGLDNYRLKPRSRIRHLRADTKPNFTSSLTENTFVAPGDFAVIYDVNSLYTAGIDGTGQTIAVMGQTDLYGNGSDITAFRSAAGLPANSPTLVLATGSSNPGVSSNDIEEASLDVEWSGAVARNATIIFVYSTDVFNYSLVYAIDEDVAPVISISYGACEANWGSANLTTLAQLAQQANSQGQTIVAAAGDSGAADCDSPTSPTSVVTTATHGLAVDAPASLPYVTGMGGSEFNEGSGNYWQATTTTTGDILTSALSYIPEMVWNDTSSPENTSNELLAGGGGASTFTLPGAPSKPVWQTGTGVPDDGARDVPDLALNASPIHDPLLLCVQGGCVNGFRDSNQDLSVVGGTSAAAPTFAGIVALVNQQMNTPKGQGNINPILYSMAATSPAAFHDITTGNNKVPCQAGTTDCPNGGDIGYSAGTGYDQASGLGSVDAYNLVTAWGSSGTLASPTLTAPANGATAVSIPPTFTWTTVTGNAGYLIVIATTQGALPTSPSVAICAGCTISTTTTAASYTPAPSALAGATTYFWEVQAQAPSGSGQNAAWSSVASFTTAAPDFSLSASPTTLTISPGASGTSTLTLTPINNFSTIPTFSCNVASTLAGVTCTVGTMTNNAATVTITASSSATSYPALPRSPRFGGWWVLGASMLCLLLAALSRLCQGAAQAHPRNLRPMALVAILAALLLAGLSCGGGSSGGSGATTPPPESGTVTVTGTSTSTTHSAQISVSVS